MTIFVLQRWKMINNQLTLVGFNDGGRVGCCVVGTGEGGRVGCRVAGMGEGWRVGCEVVGLGDGARVGRRVIGLDVGRRLGRREEGFEVGETVSACCAQFIAKQTVPNRQSNPLAQAVSSEQLVEASA